MPSLTSILAFGLLGASVFAQSNFGSVDADLVARDDMSAEGLVARWGHKGGENFGHRCKHSSQCRSNVHMSKAFCDHTHHCNFHCLGDTWKVTKGGYACAGKYEAKKCHHHHSCSTNVEHANGFCNSGKCQWKCEWGYHQQGHKCVKNEPHGQTCGSKVCAPVEGGYTTCGKWHGKDICEQHCNTHLGEKLYTNKNKTAYKCINIKNDKNNCGKPGHVCPFGYHHKGTPFCHDGNCRIDCHGYEVRYTKSGAAYCTTKRSVS